MNIKPTKPLEVGDWVTVDTLDTPARFRVIAIDEGRAWARAEKSGGGGDVIAYLSSLTRIEETADDAD